MAHALVLKSSVVRCEQTEAQTRAARPWLVGFQSGRQRAFSRLSLEKSMKADRPFLGASARTQLLQAFPERLKICRV